MIDRNVVGGECDVGVVVDGCGCLNCCGGCGGCNDCCGCCGCDDYDECDDCGGCCSCGGNVWGRSNGVGSVDGCFSGSVVVSCRDGGFCSKGLKNSRWGTPPRTGAAADGPAEPEIIGASLSEGVGPNIELVSSEEEKSKEDVKIESSPFSSPTFGYRYAGSTQPA